MVKIFFSCVVNECTDQMIVLRRKKRHSLKTSTTYRKPKTIPKLISF